MADANGIDDTETPERIMVDPSSLLQTAMLEVVEAAPDVFAVSAALMDLLQERPLPPTSPLLPFGQPDIAELNRDRVLALADSDVEVFSGMGVPLPDEAAPIAAALQELKNPTNDVYFDEWCYLASHSIVYSATHNILHAFRNAGAAIVEYGHRFLDIALDQVIRPETRQTHDPRDLIARAVLKYVIVVKVVVLTSPVPPAAAAAGALGLSVVKAFDP